MTEGLPPRSTGDKKDGTPAYYDISLLKAPVWTPEVGIYFFLGGLSSCAFSIARLADRLGRGRYRNVTKVGTLIAALAALPCAPLLIWDLGDPNRFHHMLRVWKPSSPMNLGSWTLTAYTGDGRDCCPARTAPRPAPRRAADGRARSRGRNGGRGRRRVPASRWACCWRATPAFSLSTTATPIWSRNSGSGRCSAPAPSAPGRARCVSPWK